MGLPLRHGVLPGSVAHVVSAHVMPVVELPTSEGAGTSSSSTTAGAGGTHKSSPGATARAQGVVREVRLLSSPLAWLPLTTAAGGLPQLPSPFRPFPSSPHLFFLLGFEVRWRRRLLWRRRGLFQLHLSSPPSLLLSPLTLARLDHMLLIWIHHLLVVAYRIPDRYYVLCYFLL